MNRRRLLLQLLGVGGATAAAPLIQGRAAAAPAAGGSALMATAGSSPFPPLRLPLPLAGDGLSGAAQQRVYSRWTVPDRLVLPPGYRADLLTAWGDPVANGRFGFNNDHLAFLPQPDGSALLTVNFEYISWRPWREALAEAVPGAPPLEPLIAELAASGGRCDASGLAADHPLGQRIRAVARTAMDDLGIGVIAITRDGEGPWRRRRSPLERRITGLSGLADPAERLRVSGPAAAVLRRKERLGHDDGLGDQVIGTFANCAGGTTPWGTVLSAEENIQDQVVEAVHADGSSPSPANLPFRCDDERLAGLGNPFGLVGNKYGWMVEVDPARPRRPAVKHSWLGRCRHEAVAVRAVAGQPLVVYSGCDRHGGHVYRFVSEGLVQDPADPANSRLLERGRLEAARFQAAGADGVGMGRWLPLTASAAVDPAPGVPVPHPDRSRAGGEALKDGAAVAAYRQRFPQLGDLYRGEGEERQGAILIDAHLAASAIGATGCARPEDTELDPRSGALLVAFTAGGRDGEGQADPAIFRGPAGEERWPWGWLMRLEEEPAPPGSGATGGVGIHFRWRMVATGGAPWQGGQGFANPDNLAFDAAGNLWMVTDRSGDASDVFGTNSCWLFPATAAADGDPLPFATGPIDCELTGPCFDAPAADGRERTLFLAVQHPGEAHGTRINGAVEFQAHQLVDRDGRPFEQLRTVPLGSNWPSGVPGRHPRPAVVAISRRDGKGLLG